MKRMRSLSMVAAALVVVCVILVSAGCGGKTPTLTTTTTTVATTTATSTTTVSMPTWQQVADVGAHPYAASCAGCHGQNGHTTAPALVGAGNNLAKYGNAQALLSYMVASMPPAAPGSLTSQSYYQVLGWILVWNNYVVPTTLADNATLGNIALK